MKPILLSGSGNPALASAIARELGSYPGQVLLERYPDDELHVEVLEDVREKDLYLVQTLCPPAERYLLELVLLADAARRGGAARLSAIVPYLAYARQDRRVTGHEPLGTRVIADLIQGAGVDRVLAVDLHSAAAEGAFQVPLEHLSAIPLLAAELGKHRQEREVLVSPDVGGVKRAEAYARILDLPIAVIHKSRVTGAAVSARKVVGDVEGCAPIIVDDMVSTGGTLEAATKALLDAGCSRKITVSVTHPLFIGESAARLGRLPLRQLLTTDSVPLERALSFPVKVVSIAAMIADLIRKVSAPR